MNHRFHALHFLFLVSMSIGPGLALVLAENSTGKTQIELIADSAKEKPAKAPDWVGAKPPKAPDMVGKKPEKAPDWVGDKNSQPENPQPDTSEEKTPDTSDDKD